MLFLKARKQKTTMRVTNTSVNARGEPRNTSVIHFILENFLARAEHSVWQISKDINHVMHSNVSTKEMRMEQFYDWLSMCRYKWHSQWKGLLGGYQIMVFFELSYSIKHSEDSGNEV